MIVSHSISSLSAEETRQIGFSLAYTIYGTPLTVLLQGELGSGKTTFMQGFAQGLGISEAVTSPTYALEQRYASRQGEVLHLDLYRLDTKQAREFLKASDDHSGIRCIEWFDRAHQTVVGNAEAPALRDPHVRIDIDHAQREEATRTIRCVFHDMPVPSEEQIAAWRGEVHMPRNIIEHCDAVADLSQRLLPHLHPKRLVRPLALCRAAELHDLLRFLDFREGAGPAQFSATEEDKVVWKHLQGKYLGRKHERACADFLSAEGFAALASIVEVHGFATPSHPRPTTEQKLLFYADKRVRDATVVGLEERFADFRKRYANGEQTPEAKVWYQEAKDIERELFGEEPTL